MKLSTDTDSVYFTKRFVLLNNRIREEVGGDVEGGGVMLGVEGCRHITEMLILPPGIYVVVFLYFFIIP